MPDPFKNIVVLMMENRSFDQMLGALEEVYPQLAGVDPNNPGINKYQNLTFKQRPKAMSTTSPDPKHETNDVLQQIDADDNGGFVRNFATSYPKTKKEHWPQVMDYYDLDVLYATHTLARNFPMCDHWFASVPGPTWTNRFFALSGTSKGFVKMPPPLTNWHRYDQITIFDRLNERGIKWRIYAGDVPLALTFSRMRKHPNISGFSRFSNFAQDVENADTFPNFVFIEPAYMVGKNDDHPPHNVQSGEALIANVYNTLRSNEELWNETLLVLLFDEHGGFYDHVVPGPAVPPDSFNSEYDFDRYGLRVPAILVSDWLDPAPIQDGPFDHTSLLKYLTNKWNLGPLGNRTANAKSFADSWKVLKKPRTNTPKSIEVQHLLAASGFAPLEAEINENQQAIITFAEIMESEIERPAEERVMRSALAVSSPELSAAVAVDRISDFIAQEKAKADAEAPLPVPDVPSEGLRTTSRSTRGRKNARRRRPR